MCVICYKPKGVAMPSDTTLKTCFENNSDGAGFMLTYKHQVIIEKGFKTYNAFRDALDKAIKKYGTESPYVLHFRISTQGGCRQDCCHPYPLNADMNELRKLRLKTDIGVAHNGIISLTSSGYKTQVTYNDTMKFITDYLSLIIKDKHYYKDADTIKLIERLCESRLAILDADGHCELIGSGWSLEIEDGCYYSNGSYKNYKTYKSYSIFDYEDKFDAYDSWEDYENEIEYFESKYNADTNLYDFDDEFCPLDYDEDHYCDFCSKGSRCQKLRDWIDELNEYYYGTKDFELVDE